MSARNEVLRAANHKSVMIVSGNHTIIYTQAVPYNPSVVLVLTDIYPMAYN